MLCILYRFLIVLSQCNNPNFVSMKLLHGLVRSITKLTMAKAHLTNISALRSNGTGCYSHVMELILMSPAFVVVGFSLQNHHCNERSADNDFAHFQTPQSF